VDWDFTWPDIEADDVLFPAFIEVCLRVYTSIYEQEVAGWFAAGIISSCMSFFACLSMTPEKFGKMMKELKDALPDARFPSYEDTVMHATEMRDIMAMAVSRIEFVVSLAQRILNPHVQIHTSNTFSRAVQNRLSTIMVIVDTMIMLPDVHLWSYLLSVFPDEFDALTLGLSAMCSKPFIGYADNAEKVHFSADRMPYTFAVCTLVMKEVFKSQSIAGLKRKPPPIVMDTVIEIVKQIKIRVKRKPDFSKTSADAIRRAGEVLRLIGYWRRSAGNYMA
jgi:hypothetical protein